MYMENIFVLLRMD